MKVLVINGPNLNMLGRREPAYYGVDTLAEIEDRLRDKAQALRVEVEFFQSNHEGAIIDYLQSAAGDASGIIINPGALTHYGRALADALVDSRLPVVEVHLSNVHAREEFRRRSVVAPMALGQVSGLGWHGYVFALEFLAGRLASEGRTRE